MRTTKGKAISLLLILCMFSGFALPAVATGDEQSEAVAYVVQQQIFVGDPSGNLNLESGLSRAELAVLLTRLDYLSAPGGQNEWNTWGQAHFSDPENRYNSFTDIPDWAAPYIEYCYQRGLMVGVGENRFDPQGKVNPQAACTVMLRYLGHDEADWDYSTSVSKAHAVGIAASSGLNDATITRGTMAILIHKSLAPGGNSSGSITANPTEWTFRLNAALTPLQAYMINDALHVRLWEMCRWLDVYVGMEKSIVTIDFEREYTGQKVYYQSKASAIATPSVHTLIVNGEERLLNTYLISDEIFISVEDVATWKGVLAVPDEKYANLYLIDTGKRMVVDNSDIAARDAARAEVIRLVNEERIRVGVAPLEVLPSLMDCAQIKAEDMFVNEYYSHTSPTYGTSSEMIRRLVPEPVAVSGENIATTRPTAQRVFEAWMNSPGHYAAMIDPDWTHVGVGAAKLEGYGYLYWALQFIALQQP